MVMIVIIVNPRVPDEASYAPDVERTWLKSYYHINVIKHSLSKATFHWYYMCISLFNDNLSLWNSKKKKTPCIYLCIYHNMYLVASINNTTSR